MGKDLKKKEHTVEFYENLQGYLNDSNDYIKSWPAIEEKKMVPALDPLK